MEIRRSCYSAEGVVAPTRFRVSYLNALRDAQRAVQFHLPPPAGPLQLTVDKGPTR